MGGRLYAGKWTDGMTDGRANRYAWEGRSADGRADGPERKICEEIETIGTKYNDEYSQMLVQLTHAIGQGKKDLMAKNKPAAKRIEGERKRKELEEEAEKTRQEEADKARKMKIGSKSVSAGIHDFNYFKEGGAALQLDPITSASMLAQLSDQKQGEALLGRPQIIEIGSEFEIPPILANHMTKWHSQIATTDNFKTSEEALGYV